MAWAEMAKNFGQIIKNNILVIAALILILFLGDKLRFYNYATVPHPAETADEYDFAWVGLSLIEQGVPIGWTGVVNAYKNVWYEKINVDNLYTNDPGHFAFRMAKPWFDKPPGFALIVGTYSYLKGAKEFFQTDVGIIRRLMLKIALVTVVLIFLLGTRLYNKWVGLLSALLYSIIPTTVVSSRLVLAENGYIPLFLGAVILVDYYLEKRKRVFLILAAILSAFAIFFKLSGISVLLTLLLIILAFVPQKRKIKDLLLTFAIGILGLIAFFVYGAYYDWEIFKNVFFAQANLIYGAGSEAFLSAIVRSKVTATKFFSDGWITLSWISAFVVSAIGWRKDKGTTILTIALFSYLITFLIFGSEGYGWYRFPFLPLIIIALAELIIKLFKESNLFLLMAMALLPFGTSVLRLYGYDGFANFVFPLRLVLAGAVLLFGGMFYINKSWVKRVYQLVVFVTFGYLIWLAIKEIHFLNIDTWFYVT